MKIGILGSGDVGRALGTGFAAKGNDVKLGTRSPDSERAQAWARQAGSRAEVGTFAETAAFGDTLALATLFTGTKSAIELAGSERFTGKTAIDVTNPLAFHEDGPPTLTVGHSDSGGEQIQRLLPSANVVKAFNSVGNAHMVDPRFEGGPPDMFICGNDSSAKQSVARILETFGWSAVDIGGIEGSRLLEPLCILWVAYALRTDSWNHAYKMLRSA